jgi:3-oxoacyl-[acyl-carrier protein] reductase
MSRAAQKHMVSQRYGRIVNLSSSSALNAVAPGFIATDMTAATAARLGMTFEDFQATIASQRAARCPEAAGPAGATPVPSSGRLM